jgi:hypothetical protein
MAFAIDVITLNASAITSKLDENGIAYTLWNADACLSSQPVEAQLHFETQQDLIAARNILGLTIA